MKILTSADLAIIRNKIDYRLSEASLPDEVVTGFVDEAETEVIALVENHDQLDTQQTSRLKLATIYWAAYLLADAVPILVQQNVLRFQERHEPINHEKKMERLMETRDKHLAELGVQESQPVVFELEGGYKEELRRAQYKSGIFPTHTR